MEVSGTAFRDVTNATKRSRWQASHTTLKGLTHRSISVIHASNQASRTDRLEPSALDTVVRTHAAHQQGLQSPASSLDGVTRSSQSAEVQRHARRLHRKRVAQIVVDQWKWFTKERVRMYPAIRHHKHRLMLSAFLGLHRHAAHRQLEWRRAAIFNHRRQYINQGKCLLLWHAQLAHSKKMQQMLHKALAARQRHLQMTCLTAWRSYRAYKAERRRQHLQASFYNSFVLLLGALNQWRTAAQLATVKHAKKDRAKSLWAAHQYDKAWQSWLMGIQAKQDIRRKTAQAVSLHKQHLLLAALRQWHVAVACMLKARQAASQALQVMLHVIIFTKQGLTTVTHLPQAWYFICCML